jgi:hypothetical protein
MLTGRFRIFIGWDQREPQACEVARFSLERRASMPLEIVPIKLAELRARAAFIVVAKIRSLRQSSLIRDSSPRRWLALKGGRSFAIAIFSGWVTWASS